MLRSDRLVSAARDRGRSLSGTSAGHVTSAIRHRKSLMYAGTALALAGAGSASAATIGGTPPPAAKAISAGPAKHASGRHATGRHPVGQHPGGRHPGRHAAARRHGRLPLADQLMPVGTAGPQAYMQLGPEQRANAATIVAQALGKRLGIRSAVIAVATAMQESMLHNIGYGDGDSLGLFQQQPDCGWGTAAQIMSPVYAADAFLGALRRYQRSNPSWAAQPLWLTAQGVQRSAFPFAYAKWEAQAARLVRQISVRLA